MLPTFTLLLAAGVGCRLALSHTLKTRYDLALELPQAIAMLLVLLALVPSWASPVAIPLPLGFVLGAVLPDFFVRRA